MSSSYPVPSCAGPSGRDGGRGAAGAAGVAAEERQGSGWRGRSALVIGGTEKIRTGGAVVSARWSRSRRRRSSGTGRSARRQPVHHATLGPLEEKAGRRRRGSPAAPLGAQFVKGQRERLLARAFMIRVIVLMTLSRGSGAGCHRRAGRGLALVRGAAVETASARRPGTGGTPSDGPPGGADLGWVVLAGAPGAGLSRRGDHRTRRPLRRGRWTDARRVPDTPRTGVFGTVARR